MKKKTLTGLISGLICCSLVGVGFAAWVVTGDASKDSGEGTIKAEGITDASITISDLAWGSEAAGDANIYFGAPAGSTTGKWLINDKASTEDLSAICTFTIANYKNLANDYPKYTLTAVNKSDVYTKAINTDHIIAEPTFELSDDSAGHYTLKVTFAWGTAFGGKNPYEFYNEKEASTPIGNKTAKEDAIEKLGLVEALNGATFKLTIEAKSNNGQQPA